MRGNLGVRSVALAVGLAWAAGACGSSEAPGGGDAGGGFLEIALWWSSDREYHAREALFDELRRQHPEIRIQSDESEGPWRDPPDSVSSWGGHDLVGRVKTGFLAPLDVTSKREGWPGVFPRAVLDAASVDGSLYGVPLFVTRDNTLFFNKEVFSKYGVPVPGSFADVLAAASAFDAKGVKAIAMPGAHDWAVASTLFDSILTAQAGPDFRDAYFAGKLEGDAPEVRDALATLASLLDHANPDRAMSSWSDATDRICTGQAAMVLLADYATFELTAPTCLAPDELGYLALEPAGMPTFVFGTQTMALPKDAGLPIEATHFLEVVGSRGGQGAYDRIEGLLPARADVGWTGYPPVMIRQASDYGAAGERLVLDYASVASAAFQQSVNPVLKNFADPASPDHKNVDVAIAALRAAYPIVRP